MPVKNIINVHIFRGDDYYIAESNDLPVVTQAKSLDELIANINEAIEITLEGEKLYDFNLSANPQIVANIIS